MSQMRQILEKAKQGFLEGIEDFRDRERLLKLLPTAVLILALHSKSNNEDFTSFAVDTMKLAATFIAFRLLVSTTRGIIPTSQLPAGLEALRQLADEAAEEQILDAIRGPEIESDDEMTSDEEDLDEDSSAPGPR